MPPAVILCLQLAAFWPVWRWCAVRLGDPAESAAGALAALASLVFLVVSKSEKQASRREMPLRVPTYFLAAYLCSFFILSPMLQAVIAVFAIGYTLNRWRFEDRTAFWIYGLLLLALPVMTPLQFYFSYPLRIAVARLTALLLQVSGVAVAPEGIALNWQGELLWIDELCSGMKTLWAGLYFAVILTALNEFKPKTSLAATGFAVLAFIAANIVRISVLFLVKMKFITISTWWIHRWVGILIFGLAAVATTIFLQRMKKQAQ